MSENDVPFETIADWLTTKVVPFEDAFTEEERRKLRTRLLTMPEAKKLLREATERVNAATPGIWQMIVANSMDYAGQALLGFLSGLRGLVKKAGVVDLLFRMKASLEVGLAKLAQRYARFFGQYVPVSSTFFGTALDFLKGALGLGKGATSKAKWVIYGMEALSAQRFAEMIEREMIGEVPLVAYNAVLARALPQTKHQKRVRKVVRSRKPGRKTHGTNRR